MLFASTASPQAALRAFERPPRYPKPEKKKESVSDVIQYNEGGTMTPSQEHAFRQHCVSHQRGRVWLTPQGLHHLGGLETLPPPPALPDDSEYFRKPPERVEVEPEEEPASVLQVGTMQIDNNELCYETRRPVC